MTLQTKGGSVRLQTFVGLKSLSAAGFTLLEVTVTLTILGFILLIIFGAFRLGLSAWERGESTRDEFQTVRTVTQLISRQLKSAVPYKIKTKKAEGDYLAFEGNARSLKLVSALPVKAKRPEGFVYAVYQYKDEGKEKGSLILYEERAIMKDFFEEPLKEDSAITLLEGISEFRFEYFRDEDPEKNQEAEWVDEWNAKEEKVLPKSMRIIMTVAGKNGKEKETSLTILSSIPANREERVSAAAAGRAGSIIRQNRPR